MWYDIDANHNIIKLPPDEFPGGGSDWTTRRRVGLTKDILGSPAWVSTVFLGLDHGYSSGQPILFESMAFAVPDEQDADSMTECICERYCSWADAEAGHARMVAEVQRRVRLWQEANAPKTPRPLRSGDRMIDFD